MNVWIVFHKITGGPYGAVHYVCKTKRLAEMCMAIAEKRYGHSNWAVKQYIVIDEYVKEDGG